MSKYEPKTLYRQGEITVSNAIDEANARRAGYGEKYEKQAWPKAVHFKGGEKLAANQEEWDALVAAGGQGRSKSLSRTARANPGQRPTE